MRGAEKKIRSFSFISTVYALGCTEEKVRKRVFGLKQIGSPSDDKYDRTKGAGYVAACDGRCT